ncbi:MAG: N-formylglutamate amidohydrolase [Hyphomicrobiaceae bacterium]|nr:N-formylglutamate amidohydrolase [Hyphomicrobiaceae bacterium]
MYVEPTHPVVGIENADARGRFVLVVDHASNSVPPQYGTLGLPEAELERHIAWDPGALPVARTMARELDAALVASKVSRLVIDTNRQAGDVDLVAEVSETTVVPGNRSLDRSELSHRLDQFHAPFHAAIEALIDCRLARAQPTALVAVHTFTPVYKGISRPWDVGILFDDDDRLALPMIEALRRETGLVIGVNQPYAPVDRVYTTLDLHGRSRGLPCVMIEIRNDRVATPADQLAWGRRLAHALPVLPAGA